MEENLPPREEGSPGIPCPQEHGMSLGPTVLQRLQVPNSQDPKWEVTQVPPRHWEMRPSPAPEATGGHPPALTSRVSQEGCLKTELGDLCCHSNREGSQEWRHPAVRRIPKGEKYLAQSSRNCSIEKH